MTDELKLIGARSGVGPALVAAAWAIAKSTLPIIRVTKSKQVEEAAAAAQLELTAEEVARLEQLGDEASDSSQREWEKERIS